MFRIYGVLGDICPKVEDRLQQQNRVYNTTECVVHDVWDEIGETVEHRTSRIQYTECAFCKVRAEAKEIDEQRSYNPKYRNQKAEFRWVLLTWIEDHDIGSRVAQQLYQSVLWGTLLVIHKTPVPKQTRNRVCSLYKGQSVNVLYRNNRCSCKACTRRINLMHAWNVEISSVRTVLHIFTIGLQKVNRIILNKMSYGNKTK
jgi:hypothetical protein